ncbi:type IV secretory system conjugative DNA transfer family protein [Streptomyces palmae]|uniref:Type VI secretion protein n=1 Tax=Streptomyces palmae TaxID=1701085 RepID=A0A4Z0GC53_9ACTN|nr:type VI secretion protein [Streptomyces palmae]TGA92822.1 type VI secretion protein [Streptomyces palmae]
MAGDLRRGGPEEPRQSGGVPDGLLVGVLGFLIGLTLLAWSATGLSALLSHGAWPDRVSFIRTPMAMRHLVGQPHDLPGAWPDTPPEQLSGYGLFWGIFISELLVLLVLTVFAIGTVSRYRLVRARRRAEAAQARAAGSPHPDQHTHGPQPYGPRHTERPPDAEPPVGAGLHHAPAPSSPETSGTTTGGTGTPPAAPAASAAPPTPRAPVLSDGQSGPLPSPAVPAPRSSVFASPEPSLPRIVYGAQRGDAAVRTVLDAEGPVLVVTSDPGLWSATKDTRAKLGPTHVFDPAHLVDTPSRLRWNPAAGCEARDTAAIRATALLAAVRPAHALDKPTAEAAETLLRCWLHAAAVDGRPFRQVHRWAQGTGAHEPVRILRTHPKAAGGAAGELEATLTAHPQRRDQAQELTARTLEALSSIHIRDACNPGRADELALESFFTEGGTLYLVGESIEDPRSRPGAMPLLTALAASVVERSRRTAERSSSGRLDPPVTLVLDDVAAVAPLPALPDLIAQGPAQGLLTLALMRSQEQARSRWPNRALVR